MNSSDMISELLPNQLSPDLGNIFLDYAADPIFIIDTETLLFVVVNLAACDHTGYSREELLQMGPNDLHTPAERYELPHHFAQLKDDRNLKFEATHVHRNGYCIPVEINTRLLKHKGKNYALSICRDISERKKTEKLLRQHNAAINTTHDGFWLVDAQGILLEANEAYARISGYSTGELAGMHISQLEAQEESPEDVKKHIDKIIAQGYDLFETHHRRKDGTEIDIEVSTSYIPESSQFVVFCRDITRRKQALLQLQKKERHLRQSQSISQTGSWMYDMTGQITWSDEMHRIFGVYPDTFKLNPATFIDLIHPEDQHGMHAWIAACAADEKPGPLVFRAVRPDGTIRHLSSQCELIFDRDNKPSLIAGTSQDITDIKLIGDKLRASEERLALAVRAGGIGIWDWDIVNNRLIWDDAMFTLYDVKPDNFSSTYEAWRKTVHPDDLHASEQALEEAVNGNKAFEQEFRVIHADGSIHHLMSHAQLFCDVLGKPIRMVGLNWDITLKKQQEIQLRDSLLKMGKNDQAKTRFLAAASHDLRQPVTAAKLFVHALKLSSTSKEQSDLIEQLNLSMNTFSDLLERLLDISKFDAGLIKPQATTFKLAKLFSWLQQNFAQSAFDKPLDLRFFFPVNQPLNLHTDINLLKSVLMNLLSNAIKFTEQGGILLGARLRGNNVLLQVWDTGIGIGEEDLSHIFDEFYQVANPNRNRDDGLGLGLSICQRAISLLGGEIACRSRPGQGSVFEILLPLDRTHKIDKQVPPKPVPSFKEIATLVQDKRIVVVEDDKLVATGLVSLLQSMGASVLHFYNAEEALKHEELASADYFIVDYSLGGKLNGMQFLNVLQQGQKKPIRAVIVTGETSEQFIRQTAGYPWQVLHKPIDMTKLAMCLS